MLLGDLRQRADHHLGRRAVRAALAEVVLDVPGGVEAELVGQLDLLDAPPGRPAARPPAGRRGAAPATAWARRSRTAGRASWSPPFVPPNAGSVARTRVSHPPASGRNRLPAGTHPYARPPCTSRTRSPSAGWRRSCGRGWPTALPELPPQPGPRRLGRAGAATTPPGSACCSTPATPGIDWPRGVRRPGGVADRAADLPRGDRPGRRARTSASTSSARSTPARRSSPRAPTSRRQRYLPPILRGEEVWCQGFSEPGAGSDLASLRTRAVRDGDEYVVNGQKIWSTYAQVADYCELLVRTDPDAAEAQGHHLADRADGHARASTSARSAPIAGPTEFCEVFFDDVRVPVANRVGAENDGWRVAMVTFGFERGTGVRRRDPRGHPAVPAARRGRRADRRSAPRGTTPGCAASSAAWPPSSTRCGR